MSPRTPILLAAAFGSLASCSLMDLGDFGLDDCKHPEQCDVLNERDGLGADDCVIWQCRPDKRGCEQRPRDLDDDQHPDAHACALLDVPLDCADRDEERAEGITESADQRDNDCDGLIDEDAPQQPVRRSGPSLQGPKFVSYGQGEAGALYVLAGAGGRGAQAWTLTGDDPGEARDVVYGVAGGSKPGCSNPTDDPMSDPRKCEFVELALSAVADELIVAGVNTFGCGDGQLRVGIGRADEYAFRVSPVRGKSNVEWGVDPEPTPKQVAPCTVVGEQPGARSPRIAALPAQGELESQHALVLWLAASASRACEGDAEVVGLGLWPGTIPTPGAARAPRWLQGGRDGHGEVIGRSAGCTAPSVAALRAESGDGYAVALARSESIDLVWIAQPRALSASLSETALRSSLATAAPTHVALALVPQAASARGWLVAWRSAQPGELGFAPLALDASGLTAGEPQRVQRSAEITDGPVAAYAETGFALPAIDAQPSTGGWLLAWSERGRSGARLMGLRIADLSGEMGGARILGEPFELGEADARFPFASAAQGVGFDYGFVAMEGADGRLTRGRLE